MFRRRAEPKGAVTVHLDDTAVRAAAGGEYRRHGVDGSGRAPFCMIGNCFECLVEIDGVANRQGCLVPVRDGMRLRRMRGKPVAAR